MPSDSRLNRLHACVEAVHDASLAISFAGDRQKTAEYRQKLTDVDDAWRAFVDTSVPAGHAEFADATASLLARIGDDLFYDRGAAEEAIGAYELALAIAPAHLEALKGIIAAYLQGSDRRPALALPFAERLAAADPTRVRDVHYIRSLLR